WYDLARWGIIQSELSDYINYEQQYLPKFVGVIYNEKWVTLPIPLDQIITMEGVLVQNENWK
ncbi:MAG TPA: RagB/SusD family nutrient uptake outer membrane protein, partial [Porphyromonadaceae bacterium]|nr:RagB/SusD family nutrient uptake outer membrane protein [Porphyromonadaceae bacterium]